jgi:hypothetical protein
LPYTAFSTAFSTRQTRLKAQSKQGVTLLTRVATCGYISGSKDATTMETAFGHLHVATPLQLDWFSVSKDVWIHI